jgi:phosphoenolpyruvate synthase/pyruvate phosphate dikinase
MEAPSLLTLSQADSAATAGGKAHALGKMMRAGFTVPEGFVLTTHAFQKMTQKLQGEILDHFAKLQADFVAVRSSAAAEDGANAAWAGQLDTFLNTHKGNLLQNIEKCWQSANSPRARSYAAQKSLKTGPVGVLIQKMIQSEVSGVAFSVHPVTANKEQIIIEAGLGLGEAIVSGHITPDTYITHKDSHLVLEKHLAHQTKKLAQDSAGATLWQELGIQGKAQKLSDTLIQALSKTVRRLEAYFGFPVDVEWGLFNDILYILQCRPITTLTR